MVKNDLGAEFEGPEFGIEQWRSASMTGKECLRKMVNTHTVQPLHALDEEGHAIHPGDYERIVAGAQAWVEFTLEHRGECGGRGTFKAFVQRVCVCERRVVGTP